ncbi:hypothetical protein E4U14_002915, partial [Claviceps sp. LM454 group G7]
SSLIMSITSHSSILLSWTSPHDTPWRSLLARISLSCRPSSEAAADADEAMALEDLLCDAPVPTPTRRSIAAVVCRVLL